MRNESLDRLVDYATSPHCGVYAVVGGGWWFRWLAEARAPKVGPWILGSAAHWGRSAKLAGRAVALVSGLNPLRHIVAS